MPTCRMTEFCARLVSPEDMTRFPPTSSATSSAVLIA